MSNRKEFFLIEREAEKYRTAIPDRTERIFYLFLKQTYKDARISYEARTFSAFIDGKMRTTKPDFEIVESDGKITFMEITKSRKNGTDPKEIDKKIMEIAVPNCPYLVFYAGELKQIQRENPPYDFFKSKKRKREKIKLSSKKRNALPVKFNPTTVFRS